MNREACRKMTPLMVVALILSNAAIAGAQQDTGLEQCARLSSDAERLACFDALTKSQDEPGTAPDRGEPTPGAADSGRPDMADQPVADSMRASPEPDAVAEVAAVEQATDIPAAPETDTTIQTAPSAQQQAPPANNERERPKEYTATVVAIRERPYGQMVVTLDNGETWSEQYASRKFRVQVGDTVTMKKGLLSSSYQLVAPGGRGHKMTLLGQ